jgi:hypothetical protein
MASSQDPSASNASGASVRSRIEAAAEALREEKRISRERDEEARRQSARQGMNVKPADRPVRSEPHELDLVAFEIAQLYREHGITPGIEYTPPREPRSAGKTILGFLGLVDLPPEPETIRAWFICAESRDRIEHTGHFHEIQYCIEVTEYRGYGVTVDDRIISFTARHTTGQNYRLEDAHIESDWAPTMGFGGHLTGVVYSSLSRMVSEQPEPGTYNIHTRRPTRSHHAIRDRYEPWKQMMIDYAASRLAAKS